MTNPLLQKAESIKKTWYLWIFPFIAIAICIWLLQDYLKQKGPSIKIYFDDASNIQEGKTHVRFRGVSIGMVKRISISSDNKDVIVYVDLLSDVEQIAVEGTKFWVVTPKVNLSGVSGLETFFEGPYITVVPGKPNGNTKLEFKGLLSSDTYEALENTTVYNLETRNAESLSVGDSVTFRGVNVGSIVKISLSKTGQAAIIQINIHNKYTKLVRLNTVFWKKIGIQAKMGLFGYEIKINSFESILHGGVEIFTPDKPDKMAPPNTKFILFTKVPNGAETWNPNLFL